MFKFSESFLSAIKTVMTEATPTAHPHITTLSQYAGGANGRAIASFESHNGKILPNDKFGGASHIEKLKTELGTAHARAHAYAPQDKNAISSVSAWVSKPHRKPDDVYGVHP